MFWGQIPIYPARYLGAVPRTLARLEHRLAEAPTLLRLDVTLLQKAEEAFLKQILSEGIIIYERQGPRDPKNNSVGAGPAAAGGGITSAG